MIARKLKFSLASVGATIALAAAAKASDLTVYADQARLITLPNSAASVVVGNPSIADISFENDRTVFVFGKGAGVTNLIFVNESGEAVADYTVSVVGSRRQLVTFNRGAGQRTLGCDARRCDSLMMIGDEAEYFTVLKTQTEDKAKIASDAAAAAQDGGGS